MSLHLFQSTYQSDSLVASPSLENKQERYESSLDIQLKVGSGCLPLKNQKRVSLVERKVCLILDASNWGRAGGLLSKGWLLSPDNQWASFIGREKGLHVETAQAALIVSLKLVSGGLNSGILIVLGTVNLQFQGHFVHISLRPVLGIMADLCHSYRLDII